MGGHILYVQLLSNNCFELFYLILLEIKLRSQKDFERNLMSTKCITGQMLLGFGLSCLKGGRIFS